MADTTTELEVLDQIVDVLGGQSGQHETVVPTLQQILALLRGGGGSGSGYNPSLSVGRADALTGADSTAQWATRESTGTGSATVRSVQGAAVAWNQMRDVSGFVRDVSRVIAGHVYYFSAISAADADVPSGGYIRWRLYTMSDGVLRTLATLQFTESGAHKVATRFTAAYSATSDGTSGNTEGNLWAYRDVVGGASGALSDGMLIDLTQMFGSGNEPTTVAEFEAMYPATYYPYSAPVLKPVQISGIRSTDAQGGELDAIEWETQTLRAAGSVRDELMAGELVTRVGVLTFDGTESVYPYTFSTTHTGWSIGNVLPSPMTRAENTNNGGFSTSTGADKFVWVGVNNLSVYLLWRDCPYTTEESFRAWLASLYAAGNPLTFFYALTESEVTTTPISPALPMTYRVEQSGSESIIVPEGEISAIPVLTIAEGESVADVVMDALACIATPDGPTATANHSVGTYLTMQGKLYKVTSAIAVGESIVAGTNVTETTVMAELIALTQ